MTVRRREHHGGDVLVIDKFLSESNHVALWHHFQMQSFKFINSDKWIKVFRIHDGRPLRGPTYWRGSEKKEAAGLKLTCYPTNTVMDIFIDALESNNYIPAFLGGSTAFELVSTLYAFPAGTSLSWHTDGVYKGAFIYYVHPCWSASWGGELLVASGDGKKATPGETIAASTSAFDTRAESESLMEHGLGSYYLPKPNRLIVIRPGVNHMVKKVEPNAGENMRCSISGFFE